MQQTDRLTLRPDAPYGDQPRSRVLRDSTDTGMTVDGAWLEAAVETPDGYLLFLTDDVPYEEGLRILLLDRSFQTRDAARIAWMYSTGVFRDLRFLDPRRLSFGFFGGAHYVLELFDTPRFAIPFLGEPREVWRRPAFRRCFRVTRAKPAATDDGPPER